jgi:T5SS/PEP-CTERM-associated repeat protein
MIAVAAWLVASVGPAGAVTLWDNDSADRQWSTPANWNPNALPTSADDTRIDTASSLALPVQFAGGSGFTSVLNLGYAAGDAGYLEVTGGTLTNASTSADSNIGYGGTGWLRLRNGNVFAGKDVFLGNLTGSSGTCLIDGGTLTAGKVLHVGYRGTATVVITNGTMQSSGLSSVMIGDQAGSFGRVTISNGTFASSYSLYVGYSGEGELYIRGGTVSAARVLTVGDASSGKGLLRHESGTLNISRDATVGGQGYGTLLANAPCSFGYNLTIGNGTTSTGLVEVAAVTVTLGVANLYNLYVGNAGYGRLISHGGTIGSTYRTSDLFVRAASTAFGLYQGWGVCSSQRQVINNGLVIADGEGTERDLNLSTLDGYTTTEAWDNTIENTTTNGWYATRKGRLMLANKTVTVSGTPASYSWGESQADTQIDLINSVRLTFASIAGTTPYFRFYLLAPDRTSDLPALPAGRTVIGVWDGSFSGTSFGTLGLEFRYDHVAAAGKTPTIFRYNTTTTAWEPVATTVLSGYRLSVSGLSAMGTAKIGLFAAVLPASSGTKVMIR